MIAGGTAAIVLVVCAAFAFGRGSAEHAAVGPTPTPIPTPTVRAVHAEADINSVRLYNDDRVDWLTYYRDNQDLLGEPQAGPRPVADRRECYVFTAYVICRSEDSGVTGLWAYIPLALGYEALPEGVEPQLDADIAPAAKGFIDNIRFGGRDTLYWVGRSLSAALCSEAECVQFFERAVLSWPKGSGEAKDVTRADLGAAFLARN